MTRPEPQLDQRFSDPGVPATPWEAARDVLENAQLSWITTVRADGRPHVTPLVAVWREQAIYFTTGPEEQKAANLAHNTHVALTTGCSTWDEGLDVVVEGHATRITDPAKLELLAAGWARKWDGRWQFQATSNGFRHSEGGEAHVYEVRPTKILAFGKGRFSHTRYVP